MKNEKKLERELRAVTKIKEIKDREILNQILVGKEIEVFYSKNKSVIGIRGKCVEDRQNILVLETEKGEKKILKKDSWFLIYENNYKILINGKDLLGRIEKRIKKF